MSLRLKAIIALMSVALLGLVLIQFYWIDNAIVLKKDEFNHKVNHALRNVVNDLQRHEALERMRRHEVGRQLIRQQMWKHQRQMSHLRTSQKHHHGEGIPVNRGQGTEVVTWEYDSSANTVTKKVVKQGRNGSSVSIDINFNSTTSGLNDADLASLNDTMLEFDMNENAEVMEKIMFDMMRADQFKTIEERIDPNVLDSIISTELQAVMINTDFTYGVMDYFGRVRNDISGKKEKAVQESIYKARLFPGDFFGEPFYLSLVFPNEKGYLLKSMWLTLSISTLFLLSIIAAFSYTVYVIQNQKQLSSIKNDFISNMTHELKTPISTISLACEALGDKDVSADSQRKSKFLQMISQENKRLAMLVENVLKSSIWDRSDFKMKSEEVDFHSVISEVSENIEIQIQQDGGKIELDLKAENPIIAGDKIHLTNIIYNLLDNARKYSDKDPEIKVSTSDQKNMLMIEVQDNGVGIPKDQQRKIFDKFYRVPTGNVHNVKGFGLGLNYVQNVVKNHGGFIQLKSSPGQGSTFTLLFPYNMYQ